jgi:hypothetical protein
LLLYISTNGVSADFSHAQLDVTHVLIVFHGKQRNANNYNQSRLDAIKNAGIAGQGKLLITPQFLEQIGQNALHTALSSFDAIDAILGQLADRKLFPI